MEGFKGRKFLPASRKRRPAALFVRTEPSRKITFTFFCFCARRFFILEGKGNFSARRSRRFAAAGGGSAQISLLGFMYQIW
jgi:hypothetical protein